MLIYILVTFGHLLNQFGFDVCVSAGLYEDQSTYDADLGGTMEIGLTYKNNSDAEITVGVNYVLHELV